VGKRNVTATEMRGRVLRFDRAIDRERTRPAAGQKKIKTVLAAERGIAAEEELRTGTGANARGLVDLGADM
jgi:hypothetical protein